MPGGRTRGDLKAQEISVASESHLPCAASGWVVTQGGKIPSAREGWTVETMESSHSKEQVGTWRSGKKQGLAPAYTHHT